MVNIISDYIPPFSPLPNIAPFTYKDGETYLTTLDDLRTFVNTDVVKFVNDNFALINDATTTEINSLIAEVNTALNNAGNNIAEIQTIHDQVVELVSTLPDLTSTLASINGGVAAASASAAAAAASQAAAATSVTTAANSATDAGVSASNAAAAANTAINAQKGTNYGVAGLDSTAKLLEANIPNRLLDDNLKLEFADVSIQPIVQSGRLSDSSLEAKYILQSSGRAYKVYPTVISLPSVGMTIGDMAIANDAPGAYFIYISTSTYKMFGVANVNDNTSRDSIIPSPVQGMRVFRKDKLWTEEYYEVYNPTTNKMGTNTPGWYPISGRALVYNGYGALNSSISSTGVDIPVQWQYDMQDFNSMHDTTTKSKINLPFDGYYTVTCSLYYSGTSGLTSLELRTNNTGKEIGWFDRKNADSAGASLNISNSENFHAGDYIEVILNAGSVSTIGNCRLSVKFDSVW